MHYPWLCVGVVSELLDVRFHHGHIKPCERRKSDCRARRPFINPTNDEALLLLRFLRNQFLPRIVRIIVEFKLGAVIVWFDVAAGIYSKFLISLDTRCYGDFFQFVNRFMKILCRRGNGPRPPSTNAV